MYELNLQIHHSDSEYYGMISEMVKEMMSLQEKLNIETNGKDWKSGVTNKGRNIDWFLCVAMETAELIGSFNWKHWKDINSSHDLENAKIELVDIWHFIMSQCIVRGTTLRTAMHCLSVGTSGAYNYINEISKEPDFEALRIKEIIQTSKILMANACDELLDDTICNFFSLCYFIDLPIERLYTLYIGKNALNKFRQDNGYKEGTYIKLWNGVEDNVIMTTILDSNPGISYINLLQSLEDHYIQIKGE